MYKVKLINQILSGYRIVLVLANSITITRRWLKHGYKTMSKVQSPELKLMIPVRGVFGQHFDPLVFERFSKFATKIAKMTGKE